MVDYWRNKAQCSPTSLRGVDHSLDYVESTPSVSEPNLAILRALTVSERERPDVTVATSTTPTAVAEAAGLLVNSINLRLEKNVTVSHFCELSTVNCQPINCCQLLLYCQLSTGTHCVSPSTFSGRIWYFVFCACTHLHTNSKLYFEFERTRSGVNTNTGADAALSISCLRLHGPLDLKGETRWVTSSVSLG